MTTMTALQLLGPSAGGIRAHVAALADGLTHRGVQAPVVGPPGVMRGVGEQHGTVEVPAGTSLAALRRARRQLRPYLVDATVVHAHGLKAAWTATGHRDRPPLVVTVHNVVLDESAGRMAPLHRALERVVLRRADRVIALNSAMAQDLASIVDPDRIRIVLPASPVPVVRTRRDEVRRGLGVGDDVPLVVCVARLHPQKDLGTLLRAWRLVTQRRPDARLVIVGDGPLRADLERTASETGIAATVTFAGQRDHAVDDLAASDVAVMTSVWEGASIAFAECTQLGIPLVSTPVGLAPDLLDGERGGVLVEVGDHAAVAAAVVELLDDPTRSARMGELGRARARELFAPDRSIDAVLGVYAEVTR